MALIHSSGTTGTPKSTMLAHRQFWDGKQPRMVRFPAEPYDRLMSLMPHTHAGGLSYFLTAILLGLPIVVMADWRREVVEPVMEAFQPTMIASFPRTFVELATGELPVKGAAKVHSWFNTGDSAHYGHIRRLVQLGERPAGLIKPWLLPSEAAAEAALPGSQFVDGLGSSEMGMALFGQVTTPETPRDDRCVGKPLEVVDAGGRARRVRRGAAGRHGRPAGRQDPVAHPGLLERPAADRAASSSTASGSPATWPAATPSGNFYHLDRTVDVIDTTAGPVYSLPIEEVLLADCADVVAGLLGDRRTRGRRARAQVPIAVVQLQPDAGSDHRDDPGAGQQGARRRRARRWPRCGSPGTPADFPLGPTGKVLKRELRTKYATLLRGQPV